MGRAPFSPGCNETAEASFPKALGSLQANGPRSRCESALESGRLTPWATAFEILVTRRVCA
jgi:hypothetical protein